MLLLRNVIAAALLGALPFLAFIVAPSAVTLALTAVCCAVGIAACGVVLYGMSRPVPAILLRACAFLSLAMTIGLFARALALQLLGQPMLFICILGFLCVLGWSLYTNAVFKSTAHADKATPVIWGKPR